jgi:hypothetical protein
MKYVVRRNYATVDQARQSVFTGARHRSGKVRAPVVRVAWRVNPVSAHLEMVWTTSDAGSAADFPEKLVA